MSAPVRFVGADLVDAHHPLEQVAQPGGGQVLLTGLARAVGQHRQAVTAASQVVQSVRDVGKRRHRLRHAAYGGFQQLGERTEVAGERVRHREADRGLEPVLLRAGVEKRAVEIEEDERHGGSTRPPFTTFDIGSRGRDAAAAGRKGGRRNMHAVRYWVGSSSTFVQPDSRASKRS